MIQLFLKDITKYIPAQVIPILVGIISVPILTRLFPPEEYGIYALIMASIQISFFSTGWIPQSVVRFYYSYKQKGKLNEFYHTLLALNAFSILTVAFLIVSLMFLFRRTMFIDFYLFIFLSILIAFLSSCFESVLQMLRAQRKVKWFSGFAAWKSIASVGFGIILVVVLRMGIAGLLLGSVISLAMSFPLLGKIARQGFSSGPCEGFSWNLSKEMLKYGGPLIPSVLAAQILSLGDRYILQFLRGPKEVGVYSASYRIIEAAVLFFVFLFIQAAEPILINLWEKGQKGEIRKFLIKLTRYYLMVTIPLVTGLTVFSREVIGFFTAPEYHGGYSITPWVSTGVFFYGILQGFSSSIMFHKKTFIMMLATLAAGILNIILNIVFIPQHGFRAAAITTFASYVFLLILIIPLSYKLFPWRFPFKSLIRILCASMIMGIMVSRLKALLMFSGFTNLIWSVFLGVVIYPLLLLLLREVRLSRRLEGF
ncbi:MAG: flippase [Candidatus Omnitrophota bacterium]